MSGVESVLHQKLFFEGHLWAVRIDPVCQFLQGLGTNSTTEAVMSDQQPPQDPYNPNNAPGQPPVPPTPPVPPGPPTPPQPYGAPTPPPPVGGYAPAAGYGVPQTPTPQTNNNAIIALVLAIVSWAICPIVAAIVALVFASKAKKEIDQSGGWQTGSGFVTAAKIISWINIVFMVIFGILYIILIIFVIGTSNNINDLYPTYTSSFSG